MSLSPALRRLLLAALWLALAFERPVGAAPAAIPVVIRPVAARPPAGGKPAIPPRQSAGKPTGKAAHAARPKTTTVVLYHLNRRDTMTLRLRDAQGRPIKGQQKRFDHFLRCHYTNAQHAMNPRLLRLMYQTGRHWPGRRLEVVSGYRSPAVAKNPRSPHMKGLACDFRVVAVKNTELRDYLRRTFPKVGVGYYPNSSFVHLDVRKDRSAFWIDYSGPGERSMYSQTPGEDLKTGRADQYHPTKIRDDWVLDAPPDRNMDDEAEAKKTAADAVQGTAVAGRPAGPQPSGSP
jgi:uncharacterized protein YcbK (DUF882 family)